MIRMYVAVGELMYVSTVLTAFIFSKAYCGLVRAGENGQEKRKAGN